MVEEPAGGPHTTLSSGAKIIGGAYEVERLIKAGGMGEVYRGRNVQTGRNVAIKIILASLARDEKYMALFEREALILEELAHEAIVRYQLYAVDQTTGRPCLVMQFVPGPSLKERMEQGPMPADEIRTLTRRLALGLQAAHNHEYRVYHRDLSPDNVILEDGKVEKAKLIDFGIAKGGAQSNEKSMLAGQIAGKFSYMAPEQLGLFGDDIDARTDIYSLGLIILGLFRGKAVDMGKNVGEAVMRRQSVPDLSAASPEMQPILERMLAPQPEQRPLNMGEVLQMLEQARVPKPRPVSEANETTVVMPKIVRPPADLRADPPVDLRPEPTPVPVPPPAAAVPPAALAPDPDSALDATVIKPIPARPATPPPAAPPPAAEPPAAPVEVRRPPQVAPPAPPPEAPKPAPKAAPKADVPKPDAPKSDAAAELDALFDVSRPASPKAPAAAGEGPSILGTAAQAKAAKAAPPAPAQKKSALPLILAGVAVLALGGGGAYVFLGSSPAPAPVQTVAKTPEPTPAPKPAEPAPKPAEPAKTAAAEPEKAPEPKPEPEPKPDPAATRALLQDQLAALSAELSGSCRFLRLGADGPDGLPMIRALAPSREAAAETAGKLALPGGAKPGVELMPLVESAPLCGAVELANLAHRPEASPARLEVSGLAAGRASASMPAGQTLTAKVPGADANTRAWLIGAETGRVTPLELKEGGFSLTLDLAAPGQASELLMVMAPDGPMPGLDAIRDGQSADSVIRHIAHELQAEGRRAAFDLLPFAVLK